LCCQRGNGKAGTREGRPGWLTNDHGKQRAEFAFAVTPDRLFLLK